MGLFEFVSLEAVIINKATNLIVPKMAWLSVFAMPWMKPTLTDSAFIASPASRLSLDW